MLQPAFSFTFFMTALAHRTFTVRCDSNKAEKAAFATWSRNLQKRTGKDVRGEDMKKIRLFLFTNGTEYDEKKSTFQEELRCYIIGRYLPKNLMISFGRCERFCRHLEPVFWLLQIGRKYVKLTVKLAKRCSMCHDSWCHHH